MDAAPNADMVHRMRQAARGLIRRNRTRPFEALLPWQRIQWLLRAVYNGSLPAESLRDIVALINYRIVMFTRQPPCREELLAPINDLLALEDHASLTRAEHGLLALRLGQLIELTNDHSTAQVHYHRAALHFGETEERLGEAAAFMLLGRSQRHTMPNVSADALKDALRVLATAPTHDNSQYEQVITLRYVARIWLAETQAARHKPVPALWHRGMVLATGRYMWFNRLPLPTDPTAKTYQLPYVEPTTP